MAEKPAVYGLVTNHKTWWQAAVVLQQLRDVESELPRVVFNSSTLPRHACDMIDTLGGKCRSLEPRFPLFAEFEAPLRRSWGGTPAWVKMALWGQLQYRAIVYLDLDIVIMSNLDHMAHFPPE
jgi:hypothetical protein